MIGNKYSRALARVSLATGFLSVRESSAYFSSDFFRREKSGQEEALSQLIKRHIDR